jgi:hypothetical protein
MVTTYPAIFVLTSYNLHRNTWIFTCPLAVQNDLPSVIIHQCYTNGNQASLASAADDQSSSKAISFTLFLTQREWFALIHAKSIMRFCMSTIYDTRGPKLIWTSLVWRSLSDRCAQYLCRIRGCDAHPAWIKRTRKYYTQNLWSMCVMHPA